MQNNYKSIENNDKLSSPAPWATTVGEKGIFAFDAEAKKRGKKRLKSPLEKIDERVEKFLAKLEMGEKVAVAVSGGADSTCLLQSVAKAAVKLRVSVFVIHVNHGIRSDAECFHDAKFVEDLCKRLKEKGCPVECTIFTLSNGEVAKLAKLRHGGIEDAARAARYKAFEEFCACVGAKFLLTAHTKSDNLETLLIRFLEGSFSKGLCGIRAIRKMGAFTLARPLLDFERADIEKYLSLLGQDFCTDATNGDTRFKRNKVRKVLIPLLNEAFPAWAQSAVNGAKNAQVIEDFLEGERQKVESVLREGGGKVLDNCVTFSSKVIKATPLPIAQRVVFGAISKIAPGKRVPRVVVDDLLKLMARKGRARVVVMGVELSYNKEQFCIKCAKENDENIAGERTEEEAATAKK